MPAQLVEPLTIIAWAYACFLVMCVIVSVAIIIWIWKNK